MALILRYARWAIYMKCADGRCKYLIPKAEGYWLSSSGLFIPLYENRKHIVEVISNPSLFDLTIESISQIYSEENEVLGIEGRARERIILDCINRGWIRFRRYSRECRWTVNMNEFSKRNRYYLTKWAAVISGYGYIHDDVLIDLPDRLLRYNTLELLLQ